MVIYDMLKRQTRTFMCATHGHDEGFDYAHHRTLLNKLTMYDIPHMTLPLIRGNVYKLIESYVSERHQIVEITRICSLTKKEHQIPVKYKACSIRSSTRKCFRAALIPYIHK